MGPNWNRNPRAIRLEDFVKYLKRQQTVSTQMDQDIMLGFSKKISSLDRTLKKIQQKIKMEEADIKAKSTNFYLKRVWEGQTHSKTLLSLHHQLRIAKDSLEKRKKAKTRIVKLCSKAAEALIEYINETFSRGDIEALRNEIATGFEGASRRVRHYEQNILTQNAGAP